MTQRPEVPEGTVGGAILLEMVRDMPRITRDRIEALALENIRRNRPHIERGKSIKALRDMQVGEGDSAVIVAAGPSAHRNHPAAVLKKSGYRGAVIATESAIFQCLQAGLVPQLIVSVDPDSHRIKRWFGDPQLPANIEDDYFRRQDLDEAFANEHEHNKKLLALLDQYGSQLRIALSSSASQAVVDRCRDIGMDVYWWNPMLDDPDLPDGITRAVCLENKAPAVNAGGNVGTSSWMMAHAVLGKKHVALTGMDFGYYADTPYEKTQYYDRAVALLGTDSLDEFFLKMFNPDLNSWFYTDPAYYWYRQSFLELLQEADCTTYNCTNGGILFGDGIVTTDLIQFIRQMEAQTG
jgi:hypothetical protein